MCHASQCVLSVQVTWVRWLANLSAISGSGSYRILTNAMILCKTLSLCLVRFLQLYIQRHILDDSCRVSFNPEVQG